MAHHGGLRILVLSPVLAYPPDWGFAQRVYQLVRQLAARHRVSFLCYGRPEERDHIAAMQAICESVDVVPQPPTAGLGKRRSQLASLISPIPYQTRRYHSAAMQAAIDRLAGQEPFDIIQVESSQLSTFDYRGRGLLVIDEHNIEYELLQRMRQNERSPFFRLYYGLEYAKCLADEQRLWQRAAGCLLTSAREEAILREHAPGTPTAVIPNGVDTDYFAPSEVSPDPDSIVFTGRIGYRPNADAVVYFVREILPHILRARPRATVTVVGGQVPSEVARLAGPNVVVTGAVPDVRPYVARAGVCVVPLRVGSGTRLKVLEGLAMGKAMVSTSLGCEGIPVRGGEHLLIGDEPETFARQVVRALDDQDLARALGRSGRALVETTFAWEIVGQQLADFYAELLPARGPAPVAAAVGASAVASS